MAVGKPEGAFDGEDETGRKINIKAARKVGTTFPALRRKTNYERGAENVPSRESRTPRRRRPRNDADFRAARRARGGFGRGQEGA